jgi:lipoprotein NlpD
VKGPILAKFSSQEHGNKGLDIGGALGTPVKAAAAGQVVYAGNALRGYGNLIIIKHNDDFLSAYAHNHRLLVKERESVAAGQTIAEMGNSDADRIQLHFEIRYRGKSVDPLRYLK